MKRSFCDGQMVMVRRVYSTVYIPMRYYKKQAREKMKLALNDWLKKKCKDENLAVIETHWLTKKIIYEIPQYNFGKPLPRVEIRLEAGVIKRD
ncbi:MAG: hypothetical protein PHF74_05640 [Dehalococcoidales bacterium]|nr:hypothetical protein [Dehalococcoidales bacterium]